MDGDLQFTPDTLAEIRKGADAGDPDSWLDRYQHHVPADEVRRWTDGNDQVWGSWGLLPA